MKHEWNWTDFFNQDIHPPFVVDTARVETCHKLLTLPLFKGLEVIVTSVPLLDHHQWRSLQEYLEQYRQNHEQVEYWLLVGELMRDYLHEVQGWLNYDAEYVTSAAQRWLSQQDAIQQFALIACLHHCAQTNWQARLIFHYLLQNGSSQDRQMQAMLHFYRSLTARQKDVALHVSQGLTNQEIAEALCIEPAVVAEHLTAIFGKFHQVLQYYPDKHGTRYRLIHWLTCLFIRYPDLSAKP